MAAAVGARGRRAAPATPAGLGGAPATRRPPAGGTGTAAAPPCSPSAAQAPAAGARCPGRASPAVPPARRDRHVGVQADPLQSGRAPPGRRHGGRRAETAYRLPGARPERHPALPRRRPDAGEQRGLGRERIALGVVGWPPPSADQEPPPVAVEPREEPRDVTIGRRRQTVEAGPRGRARARGDAVEEQRVKMNVEQEIVMRP
jgi:hypothetical protein